MKNIEKKLKYIEEDLERIMDRADTLESDYSFLLEKVHPRFRKSASNLVHYLALRTFRLEKLQKRIEETGLLGINHIESHVMRGLFSVMKVVLYLNEQKHPEKKRKGISAEKSRKTIRKNTRVLLGRKPDKRKTRIMVTIPSSAAENSEEVKELLRGGMNCARINCAHDNADTWKMMIDNIRQAETELGRKCSVIMDLAGPKIRTGRISCVSSGDRKTQKDYIRLKTGDSLFIHRDTKAGEGALYDGNNTLLSPAHVSCTLPEIIDYVKPGESVFFDDGKIEGVVSDKNEEGITVVVENTGKGSAKLKSDKGINFPDTDYCVSGFTEKDREDLAFVAEYADAVNLSFARNMDDVENLVEELEKRNSGAGVILKIETREGFRNLPLLLLTAMKRYPAGVMIARGDLAVETGWKNFAVIQEEIIRVCEAAHVPVIWATQVLENLAKKGVPTRSEITDAAMGHRCECVMLNKGPYILKAVKMLDRILRRMEVYSDKQNVLLPRIEESENLRLFSTVSE